MRGFACRAIPANMQPIANNVQRDEHSQAPRALSAGAAVHHEGVAQRAAPVEAASERSEELTEVAAAGMAARGTRPADGMAVLNVPRPDM